MKETIKSIIEWHEQTFPDATLEGQIEKFQDEEKEFYAELKKTDNREKQLFEIADMYIVACGIARFSFIDALIAFHKSAQAELQCLSGDELPSYINKKMEINRNRKWNKIGNKFQHIEEGGE